MDKTDAKSLNCGADIAIGVTIRVESLLPNQTSFLHCI